MIGFCTTCKGRTQHIELTLPKNLSDNSEHHNSKFVLLDYNSQDHLASYLQKEHSQAIEKEQLVVYSLMENVSFKMAHAKNMAHRLAMLEGCDILVNLDADNFTGLNFAQYVDDQFEQNKSDIFLWAKMVKGQLGRGISGRIVVSRKAFMATGGYDERFNHWGPDDKDFNARLCKLGYQGIEIDPIYLDVVMHNDKMRFREYQWIKFADTPNEFNLETEVINPVANHGKLGQGVVAKNFDYSRAVEIPSMPTRVFGIGMHKTATTSLHHAFRIMGLDSAHWENAHWAKAIWMEMSKRGRSPTLEKHYALCDLPIPLLYQELDRAYPGSKFILTVRDEHKWLASVRAHWTDANQFRQQWDNDPFTHQVHKLLYGRPDFQAEIFMDRYRKHNQDVQYYFRDRRDDLLVLDMDKDPGWFDLCKFLHKPVPNMPYPYIGSMGRS